MIKWDNKKIQFNTQISIKYEYQIKTVLEFNNSVIVHISPSTSKEYEKFILEYGKEFNKGPVFAYSKKGDFLWQWKTRYVNYIEKVSREIKLLLNNDLRKQIKPSHNLLISCQGWNFYLNPDNGQVIRQEQTK